MSTIVLNLSKKIFIFSKNLYLDCPEKTEIRDTIFYTYSRKSSLCN